MRFSIIKNETKKFRIYICLFNNLYFVLINSHWLYVKLPDGEVEDGGEGDPENIRNE